MRAWILAWTAILGKRLYAGSFRELLRHGFEDLGMTTIWCAYYDGNLKSKRVQEKLGFVYHHTCNEVPVPLLHEVRVEHTNVMTKSIGKKSTGNGLESRK